MYRKVHCDKTNLRRRVDALRAVINPLSVSRSGRSTLTDTSKKSRKKELALALGVALWLAGGGVAGAAPQVFFLNADNHNEFTINESNTNIYTGEAALGRRPNGSEVTSTGNKLTVTGGDWSDNWSIFGGYSAHDISGYSLILNDATVFEVKGGHTDSGNATDNTVALNGGATVNIRVYGGDSPDGDCVTGNTLNISGTNNKIGGSVKNFATINIKSAIWNTDGSTPALTLNGNGIVQNSNGTWATIDTSNITFTNINALPAVGESTTLIQGHMTDYENKGAIQSGKFKVGSTLQGTGKASVSENDLIYTVVEDTVETREQTHNTVMGSEVSMAALSMGNDFIGTATEGLAFASNIGADGVSSFAQMGGGSMRQETGSHIDVHTYNAILALGHQNKKERGTMEYGAFFEYGRGNYTTHAEGGLRGDGNASYTGGGALAKYTRKDNVYIEGSLRVGSVTDDARDVLRDGDGTPYSYKARAPYWGLHVGVGKIIALGKGRELDVYGKFFHNHRNSVDFEAGGHYDLDAVTSSVIRLGARYTMKRDKWNFYGGLAYEHELDGKAEGRADGMAIRGADTSGASVRAEIGATMQPDENSPWKLDLNLAGFAGKKQGFTGGVSVAFVF